MFKTFDVFHYEAVDPLVTVLAVILLAVRHPAAALRVAALDGRGNAKVRLQMSVA